MERRDFLKKCGVVVAGLGAAPAVVKAAKPKTTWMFGGSRVGKSDESRTTYEYSRFSENTICFSGVPDGRIQRVRIAVETLLEDKELLVLEEWSDTPEFKGYPIRAIPEISIIRSVGSIAPRWSIGPRRGKYLRLRYLSKEPSFGKMRAYWCEEGPPFSIFYAWGSALGLLGVEQVLDRYAMVDGVWYDEEPTRLANTVDGTGDDLELDERKLIEMCDEIDKEYPGAGVIHKCVDIPNANIPEGARVRIGNLIIEQRKR